MFLAREGRRLTTLTGNAAVEILEFEDEIFGLLTAGEVLNLPRAGPSFPRLLRVISDSQLELAATMKCSHSNCVFWP